MNSKHHRAVSLLPAFALFGGIALIIWWMSIHSDGSATRMPGTDQPPGIEANAMLNPVSAGKVLTGVGVPGDGTGIWNQFRGPSREGTAVTPGLLARKWEAGGPRELWAVDCGEGYAGAAVQGGRVYLMDYDADRKQNALRCLSLADGREIWRYAYPLALKRNHGMTRTVPAVAAGRVVALDSKCNVLCLDATNGELRWSINLVREHGASVPPWYAGQCPLIDGSNVILAPAGREALLISVELDTGKVLWRAPNPLGWKMSHSSVMPMDFGSTHFYIYCGSGGVAGISATDGALLWQTVDWKISIATIPSPLVLPGGRIFLCGGYNAGSAMLQLEEKAGHLESCVLFKLSPEVFGSTQHTPILLGDNIYGVRPNGQFVCLGSGGEVRWTSPPGDSFGLGSFLLADGLFYVMNDSGTLAILDANSEHYVPLGTVQVLKGRESWGPMALVNGRLLVRDFTHLACLDVTAH